MAQGKQKIIRTTTLTLDYDEASWLQGVMQNPLNCVRTEDEAEEDRHFRGAIYNALDCTEGG